jgi:hypothetical protein
MAEWWNDIDRQTPKFWGKSLWDKFSSGILKALFLILLISGVT